jgi:hypothetical protein
VIAAGHHLAASLLRFIATLQAVKLRLNISRVRLKQRVQD